MSSASETFHCMICPLRPITGGQEEIGLPPPHLIILNIILLFLVKGKVRMNCITFSILLLLVYSEVVMKRKKR